MSGYEVVLQPALILFFALLTLYVAARGFYQEPEEVEGITITRTRYRGRSLLYAGVVLLVGAMLIPSLVITPHGHRGVVWTASGGVDLNERAEGVTFIVPYINTAVQMDVRTQKYFTAEAFAQSSDLQEITVHVAVNYHVQPDLAADLYQAVGKDYAEVVIQPAVFQLVKEEVGQILAVDFARNRDALANAIEAELTDQLAEYGVLVEFVSIVDAVFDPAFITAVKEKVIADEEAAEQERLVAAEAAKKEQIILQAEAEEQRLLIEARGQAEANREVASSLTGDLLAWQRLVRWDGVLPDTVLSGDGQDVIVSLP